MGTLIMVASKNKKARLGRGGLMNDEVPDRIKYVYLRARRRMIKNLRRMPEGNVKFIMNSITTCIPRTQSLKIDHVILRYDAYCKMI